MSFQNVNLLDSSSKYSSIYTTIIIEMDIREDRVGFLLENDKMK